MIRYGCIDTGTLRPFDDPKHFSKGDKFMPHTIAVAGKGGEELIQAIWEEDAT